MCHIRQGQTESIPSPAHCVCFARLAVRPASMNRIGSPAALAFRSIRHVERPFTSLPAKRVFLDVYHAIGLFTN